MDFSIIFSAEFWITDSGSAQASVAERLALPPVKTAGGSMGLSASILDTLKLDPPECPHCGTSDAACPDHTRQARSRQAHVWVPSAITRSRRPWDTCSGQTGL